MEKSVQLSVVEGKQRNWQMSERTGYKTLDQIAEELQVAPAKVRTLIARLDIQPRAVPR